MFFIISPIVTFKPVFVIVEFILSLSFKCVLASPLEFVFVFVFSILLIT